MKRHKPRTYIVILLILIILLVATMIFIFFRTNNNGEFRRYAVEFGQVDEYSEIGGHLMISPSSAPGNTCMEAFKNIRFYAYVSYLRVNQEYIHNNNWKNTGNNSRGGFYEKIAGDKIVCAQYDEHAPGIMEGPSFEHVVFYYISRP